MWSEAAYVPAAEKPATSSAWDLLTYGGYYTLDVEAALEHEQHEPDGPDQGEGLVVGHAIEALGPEQEPD